MTGRVPTDQEIQDVMSLTSTSMEQFCGRMRGLFARCAAERICTCAIASGVSEDCDEHGSQAWAEVGDSSASSAEAAQPAVSGNLAENIETVHYSFEMFADAKGPLNQARHIVALADAVSDLASYHPGYDEHQTLLWQRADQD